MRPTCALKPRLRLIVCTAALACAPVAAQDEGGRAEALYDHHCRACHESWVHRRPDSRVDSVDELRRRVAGWAVHTGLDWSDEEIDAVTDYLNRRFYQLGDAAGDGKG